MRNHTAAEFAGSLIELVDGADKCSESTCWLAGPNKSRSKHTSVYLRLSTAMRASCKQLHCICDTCNPAGVRGAAAAA
jgi:hypothetical protein